MINFKLSNMRGPGVWTRGLAADVDKPSGSDLLRRMTLPLPQPQVGQWSFHFSLQVSNQRWSESDMFSFRTRLISLLDIFDFL